MNDKKGLGYQQMGRNEILGFIKRTMGQKEEAERVELEDLEHEEEPEQ